jgi:hypothetical protein
VDGSVSVGHLSRNIEFDCDRPQRVVQANVGFGDEQRCLGERADHMWVIALAMRRP